MFTLTNYKAVESLEEAYELNQKKGSVVIGGMGWLKLSHRRFAMGIDLKKLGLDQITENEEEFRIGCMATLRQFEQQEGLERYFDGACKESVRHIVGVQFRNCATMGGSIYGRFGFSDILTLLLAMDSYVELYRGGMVPLAEFVDRERDNDILVAIRIKKDGRKVCYQSFRNQATDFPVLTVAVARTIAGEEYASIGARPAKAKLFSIKENGFKAEKEYRSNTRASGEYRRFLAETLVERGLQTVRQEKEVSLCRSHMN